MNEPRRQLPDKSIEDVTRLVEESSLGTPGAQLLRDRTPSSTVAAIRARAYFADSDDGRAWWQENRRNPDALSCKAQELASSGELQISDVLMQLAVAQRAATRREGSFTATPPARLSRVARAGQAASWQSFDEFYRREFEPLTAMLCEAADDLPAGLAKILVRRAMIKAFDDWDRLAGLGNAGEWVLGYALQLHRSRCPSDEDGCSLSQEPASSGRVLVSSAGSRTDVQVTGALAAAAIAAPVVTHAMAEADAEKAVSALYSAHYQSLVRLSLLLVRDAGTAEEVVMDAFIAMHGGWRRVRDTGMALTYLRQSVINRSRAALRHRALVERSSEQPPQDVPSAEEGAMMILERSAVLTALRALPARQREALVLRYYADLSEADIAKIMGISRGAVKSHTARGISALRRVLEQEY